MFEFAIQSEATLVSVVAKQRGQLVHLAEPCLAGQDWKAISVTEKTASIMVQACFPGTHFNYLSCLPMLSVSNNNNNDDDDYDDDE